MQQELKRLGLTELSPAEQLDIRGGLIKCIDYSVTLKKFGRYIKSIIPAKYWYWH